MKLELKHLAPYLPYGLKIRYIERNETHIFDTSNLKAVCSEQIHLRPILRPLSDLTKVIVDEFQKYDNQDSYDKDIIDLFCYENTQTDENIEDLLVTKLPYECVEYMFKNHYDVFGLIEKGLAIDFNETFTQK
jgi:hypothetical protein